MRHLVALLSGIFFAAGLCLSGLTSSAKVIGFLDVKHWDPTLLFAMMGAVPVTFVAWRLRARMDAPIAGGRFPEPPPAKLDARLFAGAALFGVGWGLGGFCPGPMLVALGGGVVPVLILLPSLLAGMLLFHLFDRRRPHGAGEEKLAAR